MNERQCYEFARIVVTDLIGKRSESQIPDTLAFAWLVETVAGNYRPGARPLYGTAQLRGLAAGARTAVVISYGRVPCRWCGAAIPSSEARAGFKLCEYCSKKGRK